jgi:hypothetical protein
MIGDFFHSGHAADLILLVMIAEFIVLAWRGRARPGSAANVLFAIAPGVCLVLALRAALTGSGLIWIAAPIAASLPFHLADMARRRL